ncbi:MAG: hybrid sensor histidine kinase/response regulator [Phototrophicaceae bacterium]
MATSNSQSEYILLVDDISDNLDMLGDMLNHQGYAVKMALDGQEALDKIADSPPDLVLLDIQMPGMNGYEVCQTIKASPDTEHIPVIFLSALNETSDVVKGFDAGGVDYISKPFKFKEVMARVESQLAVSRQRKEIEALRERDQQQFESLAKIKNRFLYGTAHDLKNPLTGMLLYTQLLRSTPPEDVEEIQTIADGIELTARKMQRLITDILDLAQMQVGDQMARISLPLQPVLANVVKNSEIIAKEKSITLDLDVPDASINYPIERSYFERMLDNLVSNAIKYTLPDGTVTVSLCDCETHYEVKVADTGLGIPKDDLPKLFDAFFRVRKASHKKEEGTGLGLSMVAAIIEEHNGKIVVESEEGIGSTFIIKLPKEGGEQAWQKVDSPLGS